VLVGLTALICALPVDAETNLTGTWSGNIKGVQVDRAAAPRSPFAPTEEGGSESAPRFIEAPLAVSVKVQKDGLMVGTWQSNNYKQQFVCVAQETDTWQCADGAGRATVRALAGDKVRICYLDQAADRQSAGCGELSRTQ
jgi:hypothetical protein